MGCELNAFCASLPSNVRTRLCEGCRRRIVGLGSVQSYTDFRNDAIIVLDGLITGETLFDKQDEDDYLPRFTLITPGRMYGYHGIFNRAKDTVFDYSFVTYQTDCCIAKFRQMHIRKLCEEYPEMEDALSKSLFEWIIDLSEVSAALRMNSAFKKVLTLVRFLCRHGIRLSESQIGDMLSCDRTTVSRAFSRITREHPELARQFQQLKPHKVVLLNPSPSDNA